MLNRDQIERWEKVSRNDIRSAVKRRKNAALYVPADNDQTRVYEDQVVKFERRRLEALRFLGMKELLELERRMSAVVEATEWKKVEPLRANRRPRKIEFTERQLEIARESLAKNRVLNR